MATSQILFSLSVGFGSQLVLASYNSVNNNCHRDSLLVGIFNSLTSVFAGIVVFAVLGYLADGGDISDVVQVSVGDVLHCNKKVSHFPVPSQDVNNQTLPCGEKIYLSPARESLVSDIPAGDGKMANLFLQCTHQNYSF